jgi:hypothetical protein
LGTKYKAISPEYGFAVGEALQESKRLLAAFSSASVVGFAVLDNELRYQAINSCLASINGIPANAHLGVSVGEIFGEVSERDAIPSYHRVLNFGQTSHFEIQNAVLPSKGESRYWGLNVNFPLRDRAGRIKQIGIMVVEVTTQRKLEDFLHKLVGEMRDTETKESFWLAGELQDSIDQYHTALAISLGLLVRDREKSTELLAQSIEMLDQRIMTMGTLVSNMASAFPIR